MSKKKGGGKKRGPKGGIKHQPGRGHDAKSNPVKKRRFSKDAKKKRRREQEEARRQWKLWDDMSDEQKKWRFELKPTMPRPKDEN